MRLGSFPLVAALVLAALPWSRLQGQPAPKPSLGGVVVDSAGRPLEGASLELIGARRSVVTRADGAFRFDDLPAARYWLLVRRIGYYPVQLSLTLHQQEARETRVTLAAHPYQLPEVVVRAQDEQYRARMLDFIWRSRSAFRGRFLTADDIARRRPSELGQLVLQYLPFKNSWTMYQAGGWGPNPGEVEDDRLSMPRLVGRTRYRPDCPPAIAVNGAGINPGWAVNDFEPDEVEALEIYREGASLPIEYTFANRAACGLVVIWLKTYARPSPTP